MKFEIKNWFTGKLIVTLEGGDWKLAFTAAVKAGQEFKQADLSGRDFSGIDVNGAKFDNSTFDNSTFDNSTFDNSTFYHSTFYHSTFYHSTFYHSTFYHSTFYHSTFYHSTFYHSTFYKESFKGLPDQWKIQARDDMFAVLLAYPGEIAILRKKLVAGEVNGSIYSGECACLFGTIANARKCTIEQLKAIVKPNCRRPIEVFFYSIQIGGTPSKNPFTNLAVEWIDQFTDLLKVACKTFKK